MTGDGTIADNHDKHTPTGLVHKTGLVRKTGTIATATGLFGMIILAGLALFSAPADAARLNNQIAVFAALDKVTARISNLEVPLGETKRFGALNVTPRVCYTRPPTEPPKTTSFVEVEELLLDGKSKKLFTGWMFAESPGLNAVEHPVFDIWLTGCKGTEQQAATQANPLASDEDTVAPPPRRRRPRRRRRIRQ